MTGNDPKKDKFARKLREIKLYHEAESGAVMGAMVRQYMANETKSDNDEFTNAEQMVRNLKLAKDVVSTVIEQGAWTTGAVAGISAFLLARQRTKLLLRFLGFKPSFQQRTVPSCCLGASVGVAGGLWNFDSAKYDRDIASILMSNAFGGKDAMCPGLLKTVRESSYADVLEPPHESSEGADLFEFHDYCSRKVAYENVVRREQDLSSDAPVPIPDTGLPTMKELEKRMEKLKESGIEVKPYDSHNEVEFEMCKSCPSTSSEINLVLDVAQAIEFETTNVGELGLQPDEKRSLWWNSFKNQLVNGAIVGVGAFVSFRLSSKLLSILSRRVFRDYKPSKWQLPLQAGFASGLGTFVGRKSAVDEKKNMPELVLRPGRSPAVDEYCPLVVKHFDDAVRMHPHGYWLLEPNKTSDYGRMLARDREACGRRITYETILRQEQGLKEGEPVSIPKPGVPEMGVLKKMLKADDMEACDADKAADGPESMSADQANSLVKDQEDQEEEN